MGYYAAKRLDVAVRLFCRDCFGLKVAAYSKLSIIVLASDTRPHRSSLKSDCKHASLQRVQNRQPDIAQIPTNGYSCLDLR